MRFGILGPLDIRTDDGTPIDPGGPRPRALLTLLLLDAGRTVSVERLTDGLYGAEPPAGAANALQSQISRLRRRLAPHAEIEATPGGYRLAVPAADTTDAHQFEERAVSGRAALTAGDHRQAAAVLRDALALWRGPALPDLPDAHAERARLAQLRLAAVQDRIDADLALGGGPELVPELRALLSAHPLSERLYGQLMRALHADGRPAEALTVFEEARRTLADELGADPSAELSTLHLELLRGRRAEHRRSVPAQLTRFVGREPELGRIARALSEARLVTLTGPGGAGKTRLAIEATQAHAGACFVELAPLTDGTRIPYAVLTALDVRDGFRTPASDGMDRLLTALEDRETLLVLDNCEHLVEAAAGLAARLLASCPGVRVLATSRESLGITGEAVLPVPPLPPEPAVRLFLDRARAVRPGFEGHARVADICAALDGLPLAIELAAARLRTLTPDEVADRLDDRFRLLSRGDRSKALRHRTLRAVVEWSWDLLDDEERELASRLTVFRGGAGLEAVEAVCATPYPEDLLASLVEKSFLEVSEGRYRMLETIRAFAAEQRSRERTLRDAHAAYFLELAERAEPALRGGDQLPWLARLDAERDNLDAALRHLVTTAPEEALRLMAALSWFRRLRAPHGEQVSLARALLTAVGDTPPPDLAEEYALCLMNTVTGRGDDPDEPDRIARVSALMNALDEPLRLPFTTVLWSLTTGPLYAVDDDLLTVQIGDEPWSRALLDLGHAYRAQFTGDPTASEACFARSLAGFRTTGDRWGMANCLDPLGGFAGRRGEYTRALELFDEGLEYVQELDAPEETSDLLRSRATVLLYRGDTEDAVTYFRRAADLARAAGAPDKVAAARRGLGDSARLSGNENHARVHYESALEACAANWFSVGETVLILIGLGRTAAAEGDLDQARDWFEQARTHALDAPDVLALAAIAEALASVAPRPERAAELLGAAEGLRGGSAEGDPDVVRTKKDVRRKLSPEAYDTAFEQGRALRSAAVSER
ncbi:BTAD domain-containing putative transcriptional regulator [Streptomyces canus]|uniref:BTAD domain-containing putative transcriptional regulator n=1 Tax=Streptomyces canus TaxID=58343 RepID=UPI00339EE06D